MLVAVDFGSSGVWGSCSCMIVGFLFGRSCSSSLYIILLTSNLDQAYCFYYCSIELYIHMKCSQESVTCSSLLVPENEKSHTKKGHHNSHLGGIL